MKVVALVDNEMTSADEADADAMAVEGLPNAAAAISAADAARLILLWLAHCAIDDKSRQDEDCA